MSVGIVIGTALTCAAHASITEPNQQELSHAVTRFLVDHGDLCMAKYTWPRDVTAEDQQAQTNDALQLPVLERLGLVKSKDVDSGKRYWLTHKGQKYYSKKKRTTLGIHGDAEEHGGDFCVASLTLDKVIKWTAPDDPKLQMTATVELRDGQWVPALPVK